MAYSWAIVRGSEAVASWMVCLCVQNTVCVGREKAYWVSHPFVILWDMVLAVWYKEKLRGAYRCKWSNERSKFRTEFLLTSALINQHTMTCSCCIGGCRNGDAYSTSCVVQNCGKMFFRWSTMLGYLFSRLSTHTIVIHIIMHVNVDKLDFKCLGIKEH